MRTSHFGKVKAVREEMAQLYGGVTFKGAKGETNAKGRIYFEAKTGIINKQKKERFLSIRERFRSTDVELPTTIYLPYSAYTANKVPFEITPEDEKPPAIEIFLQIVQGPDDDDGLWLWVGAGAGAAVALGVGAFFLFREPDATESSVQDYVFQPSAGGQ